MSKIIPAGSLVKIVKAGRFMTYTSYDKSGKYGSYTPEKDSYAIVVETIESNRLEAFVCILLCNSNIIIVPSRCIEKIKSN